MLQFFTTFRTPGHSHLHMYSVLLRVIKILWILYCVIPTALLATHVVKYLHDLPQLCLPLLLLIWIV